MCHNGPGCQWIQLCSWISSFLTEASLTTVMTNCAMKGKYQLHSMPYNPVLIKMGISICIAWSMALKFLPVPILCLLLSCVNEPQVTTLYALFRNVTYNSVEWLIPPTRGSEKGLRTPHFQSNVSEQLQWANQPSPKVRGRLLTEHSLSQPASPLQRCRGKIEHGSQRTRLVEVHPWLYSQYRWVTLVQPFTVWNVLSRFCTNGWEGSTVWSGTDLPSSTPLLQWGKGMGLSDRLPNQPTPFLLLVAV